jgi:hypothetical protein
MGYDLQLRFMKATQRQNLLSFDYLLIELQQGSKIKYLNS